MKKIAMLGAVMLMAGCVSVGTNYDVNALAQLKPGMSRGEVVSLLGKPNTEAKLPDGKTVLGWVHSTGTAFGGASARSVSLQFDPNGKLVDSGYQTRFDTK
jgi:hypothetical protein